MSASLADLLDDRTMLMPVSVDQYHSMMETGIIAEGEPYELLKGHVVHKDRSATGEDPMTVGKPHAYVVLALTALGPRLLKRGCHIRAQQPLTLPPDNEPEPDAAIVIGRLQRYRMRHPGAADVLCVIEVADASLRRDRTIKQRIYAEAGIGQYLIFDLSKRVVEVYSEPLEGLFSQRKILNSQQKLSLPLPRGKTISVPIRQLFP
jgi:Uma2 family endonuclease